MHLRVWGIGAILILGLSMTTGCENSDDNTLAQAQLCLDNATDRESAAVCREMVSGYSSKTAHIIRCSADFIMQGFTIVHLVDVYLEVKDRSYQSSHAAALHLLGEMSFSNMAEMDRAVLDCAQADLRGMVRFAALTKLSTTIFTIAGIVREATTKLDGYDLRSAVNRLLPGGSAYTEANLVTLGETVLYAGESFCRDSARDETERQICSLVYGSINEGAGSSLRTGLRFLELLENQGL